VFGWVCAATNVSNAAMPTTDASIITKTGRAAIGTVSKQTERLFEAFLAQFGARILLRSGGIATAGDCLKLNGPSRLSDGRRTRDDATF
jgi:hypothetical protein